MPRPDGRKPDEMRPVTIETGYMKHPEGSCLIAFGDTKVICTASVEEKVPPFMENSGKGWVTAEYSMLPRSTNIRVKRDRAANSGRSQEISRLIGRSLRSVVDFGKLGERTVRVDCDVLQADGGTRTAAITGGFVALDLAVKDLIAKGYVVDNPVLNPVAAVSVGIFEQAELLDLNYIEDSRADMDMNVVMVGGGRFVEVQGTAEGTPFSKDAMDRLILLAAAGIENLFKVQRASLNRG